MRRANCAAIVLVLGLGVPAASAEKALPTLDRATALAREGKYPEALEATRAACEELRAALPAENPSLLRCEVALARRFAELRRPSEAEAQAARAEEALRRVSGDLDPSVLEARHIRAIAAYQQGRYKLAEELATSAYDGRRTTLGPENADTLASLNNLALALQEQGQYTKARVHFENLSTALAKVRGPRDRTTLIARNNLATSQFLLGEYPQAAAGFREVHAASVETLGARHPSTLAARTSLAEALLADGHSIEALEMALEGGDAYAKVLGERHPDSLRRNDVLARIHVALGRYDQAVALGNRVVPLARAELGAGHLATIRYTLNLGRAQYFLRDYASALATYQAVVAVAPGALGPTHPEAQQAVRGVAFCQLRLDRPQAAMKAFQQALAASEGTLPDGHPDRLSNLNGMYLAQYALGDRLEGLRGMERTFELAQQAHGADSENLTPYLGTLAWHLLDMGRREEAEQHLERFLAVVEASGKGTLETEYRQERFAAVVDDTQGAAGLKALVELRAARGDAAGAFRLSEQLKARTLAESLDLRSRAATAASDAGHRQLIERLDALNRAATTMTPGSDRFLASVKERQDLERTLRAGIGAPRPARASPREAIPRGAAYLSYVVNRDRVVAIVATRDAEASAHVLGEVPGLAKTIDAYRRLLGSVSPGTERVWRLPGGGYRWSLSAPAKGERVVDKAELEAYLSRHLLAPLERELSGVRTWIVSPDGPLALIAIEALRMKERPAIERHDVTYTQSLEIYAQRPARRASDKARSGVLVVAASAGRGMAALPAAEDEAAAIARIHGAARTVVLKGASASEEALRSLGEKGELARFRYVHFAAHAYLSATHPQLSAIVLAGGGSDWNADGYLTAAELPALPFGSDLVVVSACQSGAGRIVAGEGVMGLPYALALAGNRQTLMALWEVDDRASAAFMPRFHARIRQGVPAARALAETKREFTRPGSRWSDPRHWAPFVIYGG